MPRIPQLPATISKCLNKFNSQETFLRLFEILDHKIIVIRKPHAEHMGLMSDLERSQYVDRWLFGFAPDGRSIVGTFGAFAMRRSVRLSRRIDTAIYRIFRSLFFVAGAKMRCSCELGRSGGALSFSGVSQENGKLCSTVKPIGWLFKCIKKKLVIAGEIESTWWRDSLFFLESTFRIASW